MRISASNLPLSGEIEIVYSPGRKGNVVEVYLEFSEAISGSNKCEFVVKSSSGGVRSRRAFVPGNSTEVDFTCDFDSCKVNVDESFNILFDSGAVNLVECSWEFERAYIGIAPG